MFVYNITSVPWLGLVSLHHSLAQQQKWSIVIAHGKKSRVATRNTQPNRRLRVLAHSVTLFPYRTIEESLQGKQSVPGHWRGSVMGVSVSGSPGAVYYKSAPRDWLECSAACRWLRLLGWNWGCSTAAGLPTNYVIFQRGFRCVPRGIGLYHPNG